MASTGGIPALVALTGIHRNTWYKLPEVDKIQSVLWSKLEPHLRPFLGPDNLTPCNDMDSITKSILEALEGLQMVDKSKVLTYALELKEKIQKRD